MPPLEPQGDICGVEDVLGAEFLGTDPVLTLRVHTTHIAVGKLDVEIGGTSAAWLYNMIALVLTEQLRGRMEAVSYTHLTLPTIA